MFLPSIFLLSFFGNNTFAVSSVFSFFNIVPFLVFLFYKNLYHGSREAVSYVDLTKTLLILQLVWKTLHSGGAGKELKSSYKLDEFVFHVENLRAIHSS